MPLITRAAVSGGSGGSSVPAATSISEMLAFGMVSAVGTGTDYARNDHNHGTPPAPTPASIGAVATTLVGAVNGLATLDASGKLTPGQIPAIAITDTFPVASQAAMLALTAEVGDVAVRSDTNQSFILRVAGASTLANWELLRTPTDVVTSVNGRQGVVTGLAEANAVVDLTTAQTVAGIKTFSAIPVVPDNSFGIAKISATGTRSATTFLAGDGTFKGAMDLTSAQTVAGVKTFSSAPVVPDNSFTLAKINATGTRDSTTFLRGDGTLAVPDAPSNMVTTDTTQTLTGWKTWSNPQRFSSSSFLDGGAALGSTGTATAGATTYSSAILAFNSSYWNGTSASNTTTQLWVGRADNDISLTKMMSSADVFEATKFRAMGVSGQTSSASRYVGSVTSAAPTSGTYLAGDWVVGTGGRIFICTSAGTPGTWVDAGNPPIQSILVGSGSSSSRSSSAMLIEQRYAAGNYKRQGWYFHEPQSGAAQQIWNIQTNTVSIDTYAGYRFYINSSANPGRSHTAMELGKSSAAFGGTVRAMKGIQTPSVPWFYGGGTGVDHGVPGGTGNPTGSVESWPGAQGTLTSAVPWFYRTGSFYSTTIDVSGFYDYAGSEKMFWIRLTHSIQTQTNPTLSVQANGASTLNGTYFYTVVAVNQIGKTYTASPPSIAVAAGQQATVTWSTASDATTQVGGVTYEVYRGTSAANMMRIASGLSASPYIDTGGADDATAAPTVSTQKPAFSWGMDTNIIGGAASATLVQIPDTTTPITLGYGVKITFGSTANPRPGDLLQFTAVSPSDSFVGKISFRGINGDPHVTEIDCTSPRQAPHSGVGRFHGFVTYNNADATTQGYALDMFRFYSAHWTGSSSTTMQQEVRYGSGILSGYGKGPFTLAADRAVLWSGIGLNADWLGTARGLAMQQAVSNPTSGGPLLYVNTSGQLCFRGGSGTVTVLAQP